MQVLIALSPLLPGKDMERGPRSHPAKGVICSSRMRCTDRLLERVIRLGNWQIRAASFGMSIRRKGGCKSSSANVA
jgi:hypothetical protein